MVRGSSLHGRPQILCRFVGRAPNLGNFRSPTPLLSESTSLSPSTSLHPKWIGIISTTGLNRLSHKYFLPKYFFDFFVEIFRFWLGGAAPQTLRILAGGAKPPQTPLNGRSSHLIEAAKRGRLDQMICFSAPLTARAPPGCPAGRPAERPAWYGSHQFEQTYV